MQIVNDAEELGKILRIRNRIAASQSVLSRKGISDTGVFVMAAENAVIENTFKGGASVKNSITHALLAIY